MQRLGMMLGVLTVLAAVGVCGGATVQKRYYAHETVEDRHGVIAPWYQGQNGQLDLRVRIAAETLKRYPWTEPGKAPVQVPEYICSGAWKIAPDGTITIPPISDWANGDLGQRAAYVLSGLIDYYRYSGDPAAIAHIALQADYLLDYCLTPDDHPWPRFLVSVPTKGKPYGQADPHGFIQLDIVAEVGAPLIRAAQMTGNQRWLDAAKHWGDLLAEKRDRRPGVPPWGRYANAEDAPWEDIATGGIVFILDFFDELIRAGYTGKDNAIVEARNAGAAYLRDVLLPDWTGGDVWGRNYWDWPCNVQVENVTEFAVRYLMNHPDEFPNWRNDARNIMSLFLNRTSVAPGSSGDVFSGAWAYPESSGCCGRSLWYGPMELANVWAQYGVLADSEWAREIARRKIILATYDVHETGVVEDNIDGGQIVAGDWFKIAHPMALKHCLAVIAWMPEIFAPARENHIVRSTSVVTDVSYSDGWIAYTTHDAPLNTVDVLRLSFRPTRIEADDKPVKEGDTSRGIAFGVKELCDGDYLVNVRHDGATRIVIKGDDPQETIGHESFSYTGDWTRAEGVDTALQRTIRIDRYSSAAGATATCSFKGNQVRLIGMAGPDGGLADIYLDDEKQLVDLDCWCPQPRRGVLYHRSGLSNGDHTIRIVLRGKGNPRSGGTMVAPLEVQYSAAKADNVFGEGGGPTDAQRWVFGYTGREDYIDSAGNAWRPATEFVIRSGDGVDSVKAAWWTERRQIQIDGTNDPELYRYGAHGKDFWADFTVGPGTYHACLKFCETRRIDPKLRAVTILINGEQRVADLDIAATAGRDAAARTLAYPSSQPFVQPAGINHAVDLVFNDIQPRNGVISIRLRNDHGGEAIVQAIQVGPGDGGRGAEPVSLPPASQPAPADRTGGLLLNGGFEEGAVGDLGSLGKSGGGHGWSYVFAGPTVSYIYPESAYSIHPEWGLPKFHSGKEALRTHTDGHGHTVVYQDVSVVAERKYTASVWVRTDDLHGEGFGKDAGDSAGLIIQEIDKKGKVTSHPKQAVRKAGDFQKVSFTFTTDKRTRTVRFILDTVIACPYDQGHVTYDDCELVRAE
ncbi:MAG TPA: malectin domain-containing carbohydrate-binding protein [Phycisphaerae bacterium]|nr:malectin domain-containing carbohydrate-binding protein [Phycisphaerae bacterium]HRR84170.1 malectin domain-containing carbohydrate-binding protein [Phycisphaerae bacterium]